MKGRRKMREGGQFVLAEMKKEKMGIFEVLSHNIESDLCNIIGGF